MKASELESLIFNPYYTSTILHHFLSGVQSIHHNGIKMELIFIVLPIIYDNQLTAKLSKLNKTSKLAPILDNQDFETFFSQINLEIRNYKKITKNSLIVLSMDNNLNMTDFISIDNLLDYKNENDKYTKDTYKASYNLGVLFAKENYLSIIKKLRIVEL
jgi:hypothetical protein